MYVTLGRPANDEETGGEEERPHHHGHQAGFGNHFVVIGNHALAIVRLAPEVDGRCKCDTHHNGEEGDRADHLVPTAYLLKFGWERWDCPRVFVCQSVSDNYRLSNRSVNAQVNDSVDKSRVKIHEETDWIDQHLQRHREVLARHISVEVPNSWLSEWTAQFLVSSLMLLALRASKTGGKLSSMNRKLAISIAASMIPVTYNP